MESLSANIRLFFGVEQETMTEKSKSAYKLKVAHIVFISEEENIACLGFKPKSLFWNQRQQNLCWFVSRGQE